MWALVKPRCFLCRSGSQEAIGVADSNYAVRGPTAKECGKEFDHTGILPGPCRLGSLPKPRTRTCCDRDYLKVNARPNGSAVLSVSRHVREFPRNLHIPILRSMLISKSRTLCGMAQPGHQLGQCRAGLSGQHGAGVPQIVET